VLGIFEVEFHKLFAWAGFKSQQNGNLEASLLHSKTLSQKTKRKRRERERDREREEGVGEGENRQMDTLTR
jgi:hypothetical protein